MPQLQVIHPERTPTRGTWPRIRSILLRLYRLAVIVAIVFIIHRHHMRLRIEGDFRLGVDEVRTFFPTAYKLVTDTSQYAGLFVEDARGGRLGYVVRTSPMAEHIKGYQGPTDTLIALDSGGKVIGIRVRSSADTKQHLKDVVTDEYFMRLWTGKTWDEVAGMEPQKARIEGVSGSSLTSLCIANSIHYRFKKVKETVVAPPRPRFTWHDAALGAIILLAMLFAFTGLRGRAWFRRGFQLILIGYLGLWNGQLLAQSLFAGWSVNGLTWRSAPGLAMLAAAALIIPWTTRRPLYCAQICPHGAAQEWLGRLSRRKLKLPAGVSAGLSYLPLALIALVLIVVMYQLPVDLASIEPFDAYLFVRRIGAAGWGAILMGATMLVAIGGLIASIFVPMAYCRFGCPTGALLNFFRSHGNADTFGRGDWAAGCLLLLTIALSYSEPFVHQWVWK